MSNSIIVTHDGASIFINLKSYTIGTDHPNYDAIIQSARDNNWDKIPVLCDLQAQVNAVIADSGNADMHIVDGMVEYKHVRFPNDLSQYVINLINDGYDLTPIIKFMDKLLSNPDHRIFQQLFGFLAYGKNPITQEGNILAYKKVKSDYTSVHDGKTLNLPGTMVVMQRVDCNANPEETCSSGLHFCSKEYLSNFNGAKVIVVEISPADVVSIPVDYNNTKGRACQYKVVGELTNDEMITIHLQDPIKSATVETKYDTKVDDSTIDVAEYEQGYKDGRKKFVVCGSSVSYTLGYKDGKAHKPKQYKS